MQAHHNNPNNAGSQHAWIPDQVRDDKVGKFRYEFNSFPRMTHKGQSPKMQKTNQSTLAPESFTTFSYLASSLFMNAPNSSDVFATGSAIKAEKRVFFARQRRVARAGFAHFAKRS